jgi:hypothetical protein
MLMGVYLDLDESNVSWNVDVHEVNITGEEGCIFGSFCCCITARKGCKN